MISSKNAIIVFTKDRPEVLSKTLLSLKRVGCHVIVLDDSSRVRNREVNRKGIRNSQFIIYHGRAEQKDLIDILCVKNSVLSPFINKLGDKKWNLGYARNYAILLAKCLGLKKVLFMDDDITIPNPKLPAQIFEKLDKYNFVGSKVVGMLDDSVSGHIVRKLNLEPEEYYSGGFIAFRVEDVKEYFINQYNEDWIWMYLHNFSLNFHHFGEVKQQPFDPFTNGNAKVIAQEFGELMVDGVKESFIVKKIDLLSNLTFWEKIVKEKQDYYRDLSNKCLKKGFADLQSVIDSAAKYSATIKPSALFTIFNRYFEQKKLWISILSKIESVPMEEKKINYSSADGLKLSGVVSVLTKPEAFVLLSHGITMDKNEWNNLHFRIAQDLYEQNIASLRFDYRGHGESEGSMREMTVVGELMDVKGSVSAVQASWKGKISIVASSFGAASSILFAALNPEKISCLVLLNPVLDFDATFLNPQVAWGKNTFNKKGFKYLEEKGYILLDGEFELGAKLISEFQLIKPYEYLKMLNCPVLTIHGDRDSMVPYPVSKEYGLPNRRSKFVTIDKAEHGFIKWNDDEGNNIQSKENQKQVTRLLIEWIKKWGRS